MSLLPFVKLWLWISALATLAGWTLSALGQLNQPGYAVFLAAFLAFIFIFRRQLEFNPGKNFSFWKKSLRRFRRPLPLCYAALAILIFIGGTIYSPGNYTAINYRIPRVLNWLANGHWNWIETSNYRMNFHACGFEWLSAPLLLFTRSTRGLFLINFIPFLLLPGLVFSVFTRLGVNARVARQWMWLLPTGYNFILHAGSAGNDSYAAVYALAAMDFGCRAWRSRRAGDLWHSLLAMALLTGNKASNLPLLLPWFVLVLPLIPLLRRRLAATCLVVLLAAIVSFLPTAIINWRQSGYWAGSPDEYQTMTLKDPLKAIAGNGFQLFINSFVPPIFPLAGWWNQHATSIMPEGLVSISKQFDTGFFFLGELPTEDWSGLGFGISVLLMVCTIASFGKRNNKLVALPAIALPRAYSRMVVISPWISLLVYCAKSGLVTIGRLLSPYFPLLLPLLLIGPAQRQIIQRRWWRVLVGIVLVIPFIVLALSPERPLWPAKAILSRWHATHPDQRLITRALKVYTVYSKRGDPLAGVRALLPPDVRTVGFIGTVDDPDMSLWHPIGERRVLHFLLTDPPEKLRQRVTHVVVGGYNLQICNTTLGAWLKQTGAELVASTNLTVKVSEGEQPWYVVRFP